MVGINSVIYGPANVGVGFAIPINMAKALLPSMKKHGRPRRSWIGIGIQDVTPELATSFRLESAWGALVSSVAPGSPGDEAGLRPGDVFVQFDGKEIGPSSDLPWLASTAGVGKRVDVDVVRDGSSKRLVVALGELDDRVLRWGPPPRSRAPDKAPDERGTASDLGIEVRRLPADLAARYDLASGQGVLVTQVDHGSPADRAGLQPGDVVVEYRGKQIMSVEAFVSAVRKVPRGRPVRFQIRRADQFGARNLFVAIRKP